MNQTGGIVISLYFYFVSFEYGRIWRARIFLPFLLSIQTIIILIPFFSIFSRGRFGMVTVPKFLYQVPYHKIDTPKIITIVVPKFSAHWSLVYEKTRWYNMIMIHYQNNPHLFYPIFKKKCKIPFWHTNLLKLRTLNYKCNNQWYIFNI